MILPSADNPATLAQDDEVWASLQPRIDALLQRKVDAMQKRLEARLLTSLARRLPDLYDRVEPLVRQTVKHKNDVQDDAIIGIGAKVDAQDEAIQGLVDHVQRLLQHPLFRG